MYRAATMTTEAPHCESFFSRLYDLPVVSDAILRLGTAYNVTKNYNCLVRVTLETAESGLGLVSFSAKPVMKVLEKPLYALNGVAYRKLEKLEQDFPIITQPTEEILNQTKSAYGRTLKPFADRLKPVSDRVNCVMKCSYDKVNAAKDYTQNKAGEMTSYGFKKVSIVKTYALEKLLILVDVSSMQISCLLGKEKSQMLTDRIVLILAATEERIDKYLPPVEGSEAGLACVSAGNGHEVDKHHVIGRLWGITCVATHRGRGHVIKKVNNIRERYASTISKISPSNLVEYLCLLTCGLKNRVFFLWREICKPTDAPENKEHEQTLTTYERQLITAVRRSLRFQKVVRDSLDSMWGKISGPMGGPHEAFQAFLINPRKYLAQPLMDLMAMDMKQLNVFILYLGSNVSSMTSSMKQLLPSKMTAVLVNILPVPSEQNHGNESPARPALEDEEDIYHSPGKSSGHNSDHQDEGCDRRLRDA